MDTRRLTTSSTMTPTHHKKSDLKNNIKLIEFSLYLFPTTDTKTCVIAVIVVLIGLPLIILAMYRLYSLVRDNHVAAVYVVNLLISDLIRKCCLMIWVLVPKTVAVINVCKCIYYIGLLSSVGFMVCVVLERYLVVASPLWCHFRRNIKFSVLVSVMIWVLCFTEFLVVWLISDCVLIHSIFFLFPFPVLIFCLAVTLKSLLSAISVTPEEKRRILGTLVLVLINYTLLFLPWIIWLVSHRHTYYISRHIPRDSSLYLSLLQFSPLGDLIVYVLMKNSAVDKLLAFMCWCRMTGEEEQSQVTTTNQKNTENVSSV